jgi:hypothetical protein
MIEKFRDFAQAAIEKVAAMHIRGAPRLMVYAFISLIFVCLLAFLAGWGFNWFIGGKSDLEIMIKFIGAISSVPFIAAIGFFGKALVDEDSNGVPDEFEKKEEKRCER